MASEHKDAKDVGSRSPASESAKEQRMSGTSGGAQASGESSQDGGKQPPQTSGRRDPAHEHDGAVRRGYEAAQDPERQGAATRARSRSATAPPCRGWAAPAAAAAAAVRPRSGRNPVSRRASTRGRGARKAPVTGTRSSPAERSVPARLQPGRRAGPRPASQQGLQPATH
jgi:hypothetical protein